MQIQEGDGWRLRVDPTRRPFGALIGSDTWAVELSPSELAGLRHAVATLVEQYDALRPSLMPAEQIELELDLALSAEGRCPAGAEAGLGGSLYVALEGDDRHWSLRLVLTPAPGSRAVEGSWVPAASPALAAALASLEPLPSTAD